MRKTQSSPIVEMVETGVINVERILMAKMPVQKPGKSEQVVCTPQDFLDALQQKLYISTFVIDLAADEDNRIKGAKHFYDEKMNALTKNWAFEGWGFCNPPYEKIGPWVKKGWEEGQNGARTAMLLPAGVGSNWWRDWVHNKAHVLLLNGRVTFVGHKFCYPKDLVVLLYTPYVVGGYEVWKWQ